MSSKLSIIIPFCNEYPQVLFTVQSIAQELIGRIDFEIIAVNNYCDDVKKQGTDEDKGYDVLQGSQNVNKWLTVLQYKEKLSHWNAKNLGVQKSNGDILWFCDAHCVVSRNSLYPMFRYYRAFHENLNGTLHLPLTYKILDPRRLVYKLLYFPEIGEVHYSFTGYHPGKNILHYRVPCMSTCGMMMTRELYDHLGGWPKELGIYGGGENFLNFTLGILGKSVNIFCGFPLFHHGEKRAYSWNYDDYSRNRIIATYMFGGKKWAQKYSECRKGSPMVMQKILGDVLEKCKTHRELIKGRQVMTIGEWADEWKRND